LEFPRIRRKLEQQVAFLHKLAGREVNLDQTSVHEGSDLDFDRSSHCALIFEHLGRSLLSPSQLDHRADCGAGRHHPQTDRESAGGPKSSHNSLLAIMLSYSVACLVSPPRPLFRYWEHA